MRRIIAAAAVCMMCMFRAGADDYGTVRDEQSFRRELAAKTSAVSSIQTKFVQEKYMSVFSSTVKSDGRFFWQKDGGKICLDYQAPAKYSITIAGDKIKTVTNGRATVISAKGNPMMDQMGTLISACMTGNISAIGAGFRTSVQESASDYRLTIIPQSQTVRSYISKMEIHLDKSDMSVNRLVMYENGTDYTAYIFSEKKFNEKIPASVFDVR